MAYAATVTVTHLNGKDFKIDIIETDCATGSETLISGLPRKGRIVGQFAQLTGGGGATIDPVIGLSTDPASSGYVVLLENDTAAAKVANLALPEIPYHAETGILYHRSVPNTASNNAVSVRYLIKEGW